MNAILCDNVTADDIDILRRLVERHGEPIVERSHPLGAAAGEQTVTISLDILGPARRGGEVVRGASLELAWFTQPVPFLAGYTPAGVRVKRVVQTDYAGEDLAYLREIRLEIARAALEYATAR